MLLLFLLGSGATFLGVMVAMWAVGGESAFGELYFALGGMFVGTYTGGSVNFNAVALEYGVMEEPVLYAGAAVVDSLATTFWMVATVLLPRMFGRRPRGQDAVAAASALSGEAGVAESEVVSATDLAGLMGLGLAALWVSEVAEQRLADSFGLNVPSILILTTVALLLAQLPRVERMRGAQVVGWFAILLFLAVIGALCDLEALGGLGALAPTLSVFVFIVVAVHGLVVFGAARLGRLDVDVAAVASQANIGGGTSALALARSLERSDLALPAILVGALGNALGTYLGFLAAALLA